MPIPGMLTIEDLRRRVDDSQIDTVLLTFTDIYGRQFGKRLDARFFLEGAPEPGTHACDYLLTTDMEMDPSPGLSIRQLGAWLRRFPHGRRHGNPASRQLARPDGPRDLRPSSTHFPRFCGRGAAFDFKAADRNGPPKWVIRRWPVPSSNTTSSTTPTVRQPPPGTTVSNRQAGIWRTITSCRERAKRSSTAPSGVTWPQSGIPVECSKGEWGKGQHELNVRYSDILTMADRHAVFKQCFKEVADSLGMSVTFMAKPDAAQAGSSCHVHMSLWQNGKNVMAGENALGPVLCSDEFRWFLGGWIAHAPEFMVFYAPTVNSYKRFRAGSWAPTRLAWSHDNRTASFRVVGKGPSLRIECRIPGADCNPYLCFAAALASGLDGIANKIEPPPLFEGDAYAAQSLPSVPATLREATAIFDSSPFVREALGAEVAAHYSHFFEIEQSAFDTAVTDWERKRYFEQI